MRYWHALVSTTEPTAMSVNIIYDLSTLLLGLSSPTPTGFESVDLTLVNHIVENYSDEVDGVLLTGLGPVLLKPKVFERLLDRLDRTWGESGSPDCDPHYQAIRRQLLGMPPAGKSKIDSKHLKRAKAWASMAGIALRSSLPLSIPKKSIFIHTGQFPHDSLFRWLDFKPGVKSVFFVHDLLPLRHPEWFTESNTRTHRKFLDIVVRRASACIVNTKVVAAELSQYLRDNHRFDVPILVEATPSKATVDTPADLELKKTAYFIICGTIEARKNHSLLIDVWRQLAMSSIPHPPKLVIAGARGWRNDNVFAALDDDPLIRANIIEATGLSTNGLFALIRNAAALLIPSFDEGYGLPLIEAQSLGTPVIASDIAVFREIAGEGVSFYNPFDADAWKVAIETVAMDPEAARASSPAARAPFGKLRSFIESI